MKPNDPSTILPRLPEGARVCIVRLRSLGDIVLLTPALAALHAWRPDLRLTVVLEPAFAEVLEGNPHVRELVLFRGVLSCARALRQRSFHAVFNQHGGPTSALLTRATRAPVRVCWAGRQFGFFYTVRVPLSAALQGRARAHTVEHRLAQFHWTGLPRGPLVPAQVFPQADAVAAVEQKLAARGLARTQAYAVLHPGANYFTKRWAIANFAETARWLHAARGLVPVVVLGPGDQEAADSVRQQFSAPAVVLEALRVRELIALLAGARLFVGNDSGVAHLAAAAQRPVVTIFGSSDSVAWGPWQAPHRIVQNDFPCNPCPGDRCYAFDEPRCILSVTLDQVKSACAGMLAGEQPLK